MVVTHPKRRGLGEQEKHIVRYKEGRNRGLERREEKTEKRRQQQERNVAETKEGELLGREDLNLNSSKGVKE